MSKDSTKHTSGPWTNGTMGLQNGLGGQIMRGKKHVATCHYGSNDTPNYEEMIANARLIALCPQMLEALRNVMDVCSEVVEDLFATNMPNSAEAIKALADMAETLVEKAETQP